MERAGRNWTRRRVVGAIGTDGQTDQCGFPHRNFDPAGQHYESGARRGAIPGASAGFVRNSDRATAVAAPRVGCISRAGGSQKTATAKIGACVDPGAARARAACDGPRRDD